MVEGKDWVSYLSSLSPLCHGCELLLTNQGAVPVFPPGQQQSQFRAVFASQTFSVLLLCDLGRSTKSMWSWGLLSCSGTAFASLHLINYSSYLLAEVHGHVPKSWRCWKFFLQESEVIVYTFISEFFNVTGRKASYLQFARGTDIFRRFKSCLWIQLLAALGTESGY